MVEIIIAITIILPAIISLMDGVSFPSSFDAICVISGEMLVNIIVMASPIVPIEYM